MHAMHEGLQEILQQVCISGDFVQVRSAHLQLLLHACSGERVNDTEFMLMHSPLVIETRDSPVPE